MPTITNSFIFTVSFILILLVVNQASSCDLPISKKTKPSCIAIQKPSVLQTWIVNKIMRKTGMRNAPVNHYNREGKIKKVIKKISKLALAVIIFLIAGLLLLFLVNTVLGTIFLVTGLVLLLLYIVFFHLITHTPLE